MECNCLQQDIFEKALRVPHRPQRRNRIFLCKKCVMSTGGLRRLPGEAWEARCGKPGGKVDNLLEVPIPFCVENSVDNVDNAL